MPRDKAENHQRALDARQPDLTVLMDAVTKPHNVSAIIRTADAVGIQASAYDLDRRAGAPKSHGFGWRQALGRCDDASVDPRGAQGYYVLMAGGSWQRTVAKNHAIIAKSTTRRRWRSLSAASALA